MLCDAIVCYHWNDFNDYLYTRGYVINKLAFLVWDLINMEYIMIIIVVVANDIPLISPSHTILRPLTQIQLILHLNEEN